VAGKAPLNKTMAWTVASDSQGGCVATDVSVASEARDYTIGRAALHRSKCSWSETPSVSKWRSLLTASTYR